LNNIPRTLLVWAVVLVVMLSLFNYFKPGDNANQAHKSYSQVFQAITDGEVREAYIGNHEIVVTVQNSSAKWTAAMPTYDQELLPALRAAGVNITIAPPTSTYWYSFLGGVVQVVILVAIWIFFMRQIQGGGKAMNFAKSRARMLSDEQKKVTFEDVAGIDEAKGELEEIIEFLREPQKFVRLGGRIPKGVLLMGAPGTGKTLLARAIAGEAGVPFFSISGSDFVEMFVGVGASRVRDMFGQAKKSSPCILFIDEIDAVGRHRGAGLGGGHDEREQTLNQLLVEMDGFEANEALIVIAATNRPDVLDPALLRPGRFDRQVVVPVPDVRGREQILKVHSKKVPLASEVSLAVVARGTPGFSGADLENLINEAALMAARHDKDKVEGEDLDKARDKILMGVERKSMFMSEEEKTTTAWHEGGHALVSLLLPGTDPLHKVSIIPRGRALGVTQYLPVEDRYTHSKTYFEVRLATLLAGRVAEELALSQMTTGAANDIERASNIARDMVCRFGMSEALGPLCFGKQEEQIFLGREIARHRDYSEQTARLIDAEVTRFVTEAHEKATGLLKNHLDILGQLAKLLLEKETLDAEEVIGVCAPAILAEGLEIPKVGTEIKFPAPGEASDKPSDDKAASGKPSDDKAASGKPSDDKAASGKPGPAKKDQAGAPSSDEPVETSKPPLDKPRAGEDEE
jgi:cell division protease FtsH